MSLSLDVCSACFEEQGRTWGIEDNQRWIFYRRVRCVHLPLKEYPREVNPDMNHVPTMQELMETSYVMGHEAANVNELPPKECPFSAEHAVMTGARSV